MTVAGIRSGWLRRRSVLGMASAVALVGTANAHTPDPLVRLTVVDRETGQEMRAWRHHGRLFVAGRPGGRYALHVANNSGERVLVVMSVDGVNVITGETADYGQSGYVFNAYQSYDVTGWRKSDDEVAAFTFAPLPRSYAARTGRAADVGVIGLAVFREFVPKPAVQAPVPAPGGQSSSGGEIEELVVTGARRATSPAPSSAAERPSEKLGTGHGAREWSAVTNVTFVRATSRPQLVTRIEYDSYENLVAMGVIRPVWDRGRVPQPFPSHGYVPDPPGGL